MSVSFRAYAAIGCKVPVEKAKKLVQHRGCGHEIVIEGQKNCPFCGAPTWVESVEWIFPLDNNEEIIVGDLEAIFSTDQEELIVAALSVEASSYYDGSTMTTIDLRIDTYREQVRLFLEPLGLWDESLFGLWAVPYVSY